MPTLTDRNEITSAAMSPSMWKLSATSDIEFVTYPVTISTKKKPTVSVSTVSNRHFLPLNFPILNLIRKRCDLRDGNVKLSYSCGKACYVILKKA